MQRQLGEMLISQGSITDEQLRAALEEEGRTGESAWKILLSRALVTERDLIRARAAQIGIPFIDTQIEAPAPEVINMVPADVARRQNLLPMRFEESKLVVAMAEPTDRLALGELQAATGREIIPAASYRPDLAAAIERSYPSGAQDNPFNGPVVGALATAQGNGRADGPPPPSPATSGTMGSEDLPLVEAAGREAPAPPQVEDEEKDPSLAEFLFAVIERGASDLHLTSGLPPMLRVNGELTPLVGFRKIFPKDLQEILYSMMSQKQREQFEQNLELDMSYSLPGKGRFRVNIFQQRDSMGAVMRLIPFEIKTVDELGLPATVKEFTRLRRGMVLVTGVTGSGKSTTLAALIDIINSQRAEHIMTVEDPIEFLHKHKRSIVNQREVGSDTHGFSEALRHVLRQDPDVILVGELRDLETISTALTAAETGHLVFATLHTQDAPQSVDRIIDVFPPHAQEQIRIQLAGTLAGVVSQQLLPTPDGSGRVVACEVLTATDGVRNLIREGKTHQIYSSMQAGGKHGMQVMDQHLAELVKSGAVSYDMALERCHHLEEFTRLTGKA